MGQQYPEQPVPAVAGVVIRRDDHGSCEVLLVKRANPPSQGEWSLPGGVLELGETLEAGVIREIWEETGVRVEPVVVLEVLDHIVYDDVQNQQEAGRVRFHYVLIDFLCRPVDQDTGDHAAGASDALDARWVRHKDVATLGLSSRTVCVIEKGFGQVDD